MKLSHWYLYLNMLVIFGGAALYGYWQFLDGTLINPIIIVYTDRMNYPTDKTVYKAGDTVNIEISFCKLREIPANFNVHFVDSIILAIPQSVASVPKGCYGQDKKYALPIATISPDIDMRGNWRIEGTVSYKVNPIRTISFNIRTQPFDIEETQFSH